MRTRLKGWLHKLIYFYPFFTILQTCAVTIFRGWRCKVVAEKIITLQIFISSFVCWSILIVIRRPVIGQRLGKHIPAATNMHATIGQLPLLCNALLIQQQRKRCFLCGSHIIHCWATDVFSMGPPRDYISSPVVNQKWVIEGEGEWSESSVAKEEGFGWRSLVSYCNWLWLREIVQQGVNKSNHPTQNPLLLVTKP
jgi:hypothetical protein